MRHSQLVQVIKTIAREKLMEAEEQVKADLKNRNKKVAVTGKETEVPHEPNKIIINPTLDSIDQRR